MRRLRVTDDDRGPRERLGAAMITAAAAAVVLIAGIGVERVTAGPARASSSAPVRIGMPAAMTSPRSAPVDAAVSRRVVDGVPEGWPHTEEGARTAATAFVQVEVSDLIATPDAYRAAWREMCSPAYYASGGRQAAEAVLATQESTTHLVSNAARGQRTFLHLFPLTSSVVAYDGDTASVRTWSLLVAHPGDGPTVVTFDAGTVVLRWVGDDWKLDGGHGSSSAADGASGALELATGPTVPFYVDDPAVTP